jgi:hypothetical protein
MPGMPRHHHLDGGEVAGPDELLALLRLWRDLERWSP